MATELNVVKTLAIVKSAIANDAAIQIAEGKNAMLRMRPYVDAYAAANEEQRVALTKSAEDILNAARDRIVAHYKSMSDPRKPAEIAGSRASEFRTLMRFGEFKCYRTVLDYFSNATMNFDDVLAVAKFCMFKPRPKGEVGPAKAMPFDRPAPSKMQCLTHLRLRKKNRRGTGGTTRPKDASKAVDLVTPVTKGLLLWFGEHKAFKAKAAKQLDIMVRAAAELQSIAKEAKAA
jgi:hypothetical protein